MSLSPQDGICRPEYPCLVIDECRCWTGVMPCDTPDYPSAEDRVCDGCGWPEVEHGREYDCE